MVLLANLYYIYTQKDTNLLFSFLLFCAFNVYITWEIILEK